MKKMIRKAFRKLSKKYRILNDRLIYRYKVNNKILEKKIRFIIELNDIFYTDHIGGVHYGFEKAKKGLLNSDIYF